VDFEDFEDHEAFEDLDDLALDFECAEEEEDLDFEEL
jgi:hypothetical protein